MMHGLRLLLLFVVLGFPAPPSPGETMPQRLAVVTAADNPHHQLSMENIKLIFKRKAEVDDQGNRWIPLNLPATDPIRRAFSLALFDQLPEDMDDFWNAQYFHGIAPPQVVGSEEAVLRFVTTTPGAIGYIGEKSVDRRVKVLQTIPIAR